MWYDGADVEEEYTQLHQGTDPPLPARHVRWLPLAEGEIPLQHFSSERGVVDRVPATGDVLVFTNRRVISFVETGERKEVSVAPLDEVTGASIKYAARTPRDMYQGPILITLAIFVFVASYVLHQETLAYVLAGALAVIGGLLSLRNLLWEEEGEIQFQGPGVKVSCTFRGRRAGNDVRLTVNRFFELKQAGRYGRSIW